MASGRGVRRRLDMTSDTAIGTVPPTQPTQRKILFVDCYHLGGDLCSGFERESIIKDAQAWMGGRPDVLSGLPLEHPKLPNNSQYVKKVSGWEVVAHLLDLDADFMSNAGHIKHAAGQVLVCSGGAFWNTFERDPVLPRAAKVLDSVGVLIISANAILQLGMDKLRTCTANLSKYLAAHPNVICIPSVEETSRFNDKVFRDEALRRLLPYTLAGQPGMTGIQLLKLPLVQLQQCPASVDDTQQRILQPLDLPSWKSDGVVVKRVSGYGGQHVYVVQHADPGILARDLHQQLRTLCKKDATATWTVEPFMACMGMEYRVVVVQGKARYMAVTGSSAPGDMSVTLMRPGQVIMRAVAAESAAHGPSRVSFVETRWPALQQVLFQAAEVVTQHLTQAIQAHQGVDTFCRIDLAIEWAPHDDGQVLRVLFNEVEITAEADLFMRADPGDELDFTEHVRPHLFSIRDAILTRVHQLQTEQLALAMSGQ